MSKRATTLGIVAGFCASVPRCSLLEPRRGRRRSRDRKHWLDGLAPFQLLQQSLNYVCTVDAPAFLTLGDNLRPRERAPVRPKPFRHRGSLLGERFYGLLGRAVRGHACLQNMGNVGRIV